MTRYSEKNPIDFAREFLERNIPRDDIRSRPEPTEAEYLWKGKELEARAKDPDTGDYDVLIMIAADLLRDGCMLPEGLATFAADVLEGKQKRPTKRGPDKYANWERDYKLWRTAHEVAVTFDLPLYSNNELFDKDTAAKVVSKASGHSVEVVTKAIKKLDRQGAE